MDQITNTPPPEPRRDPSIEVDPRTTTGAFRILVRREYGRRRGDKPWWWVLAYHAMKGIVGVLPYVLAAILLKKCGLTLPGGIK